MGDLIGRMFYGLINFLNTTLGKITLVLVAPLVAFFTFLFQGITTAETYFNSMIDTGLDEMGTAVVMNGGTFLGIANSLVPIDSMFRYSSILIVVWLFALVYRTVKSFIPTLS